MASPWTRYRLYDSCCYGRDIGVVYSIISARKVGLEGYLITVALIAFLGARMTVYYKVR